MGLSGPTPEEDIHDRRNGPRLYCRRFGSFNAQGPYYLGGSSFGGWVAYEMARQLTASGQPWAWLRCSIPPCREHSRRRALCNGWRQRIDTWNYRFTLHWQNAMVLHPRSESPTARESKTRHPDRIGYDQRQACRTTIQWVNEAGHWAANIYFPGEYSGDITLFRATEPASLDSLPIGRWAGKPGEGRAFRSTTRLGITPTWSAIPARVCWPSNWMMRWRRPRRSSSSDVRRAEALGRSSHGQRNRGRFAPCPTGIGLVLLCFARPGLPGRPGKDCLDLVFVDSKTRAPAWSHRPGSAQQLLSWR